ncbi:NERD domain-containing protein [Alkalicoccus daliensis]|uniref:HRDC domain-containing protein n=1 Tax=Alkalicoccus daliensis TaxID=745820 RepID=A0A1H0HBD8_9BACI|nr:NERD domain-containing protein [Alkalicoccus daliensis]SDO16201.1 HRDC domain-containing protein [Alkalicoccus daliensis]
MTLKNIYDALFDRRDIKTAKFSKKFTETPENIMQLQSLLEDTSGTIDKKRVEKDLALFKIGMIGESQVNYELKNSMLPIVCLHDVRLQVEDYTAQFDFIVITHSVLYVIETKKLYGDIDVNGSGEFIRKIKNRYGKIVNREGMYSPVTQSERHSRILQKMLSDQGLIKKTPVKPIVVMANPKSIIDKKKAPKAVQDMIIKSDQLVNYLSKDIKLHRKDRYMLDKFVTDISDFIISRNKTADVNIDRYKLDVPGRESVVSETAPSYEQKTNIDSAPVVEPTPVINDRHVNMSKKNALYKELKEYRLKQAKAEEMKPYLIFYNSTLDEIIDKMPGSVADLMNVKGFGKVKGEKYGPAIVEIVRRHR